MASSSSAQQPLQEWLVIVPDHDNALQKRIDVRMKHLEGLKGDREDMWLWGGTLDLSFFLCSTLTLVSA
jgi:hypothetical protein